MNKSVKIFSKRYVQHKLNSQWLKKQSPPSTMAVASLQVIGGTPSIPPALIYTDSDNKGFLINAGEGIQRMILESPGLRIGNITAVLTTKFSWSTCASIPGIALFRRDQMKGNAFENPLMVWGNDKLNSFLKNTNINCFADEAGVDRHLLLKEIDKLSNIGPVLVHTVTLPSSYCYVFLLPQKAGSVDKEKLKSLKIPAKMIAELFQKGSVSIPDGRTIDKSDLTLEPEVAPMFIVVDCVTEEDVDCLLEQDFEKFFDSDKHKLLIIAHFTSPTLVKTKKYKRFVETFSVDHLFLWNNPASNILSDCAERNSILSSILPMDKLYVPDNDTILQLENSLSYLDASTMMSQHLLKYHFYGGRTTKIGYSNINIIKNAVNFNLQENNAVKIYSDYVSKLKIRKESEEKFNDAVENPTKKLKTSFKCPEILFLGTTSTYSSTYRNVSGILIQSSELSVLLDCGEMTVGQLIRMYGPQKAQEIISKLDFLYISHIHFDHCGGFLQVAEIFYKINSRPLTVLCPIRMVPWIRDLTSFGIPMNLVPLGAIASNGDTKLDIFDNKHGVSIKLCSAIHTRDAWCIAVTTNSWKLAYSGDTMPNKEFIKIGKHCDILIHEATHQSSLEKDAASKRHSTVKQAIEVGQEMSARYTILTHFSLRYQKIPPIEDVPDNVAYAHDFMKITSENIDTWCESTNCLPLLFPVAYSALAKASAKIQSNTKT